MKRQHICFLLAMHFFNLGLVTAELPRLTTLSDPRMTYKISSKPYASLSLSGMQAVFVNHEAVDDDVLPGHRAGYAGIASLTTSKQPRNLFVPAYAGLNFEHIFDGQTRERDILFEPRRDPMQLRVIDDLTVELYQQPTRTWKLESCTRYQILPKGVIEMTFECIPRGETFENDYMGLFWASYINAPESKEIHFRGAPADQLEVTSSWIKGVTPKHGVHSTHVGVNDQRVFAHDEDFPLSLVYNRSQFRFMESWYYGVSHGMAMVLMFRESDQIRLTQSPSGGGQGNPAWDFQWFIEQPQVGQRYQMIMRTAYVPFESAEQIQELARTHRRSMDLDEKMSQRNK